MYIYIYICIYRKSYIANDAFNAQRFSFVAFLTFRLLGHPQKSVDRQFISSSSSSLPLRPLPFLFLLLILILPFLTSSSLVSPKRH